MKTQIVTLVFVGTAWLTLNGCSIKTANQYPENEATLVDASGVDDKSTSSGVRAGAEIDANQTSHGKAGSTNYVRITGITSSLITIQTSLRSGPILSWVGFYEAGRFSGCGSDATCISSRAPGSIAWFKMMRGSNTYTVPNTLGCYDHVALMFSSGYNGVSASYVFNPCSYF